MRPLIQDLNTEDDSFSYTLLGESDPLYRVDSNGYLTERGVQIGKFRLSDKHWRLVLDDGTVHQGLGFGTFRLPEFELHILSRIANRESLK